MGNDGIGTYWQYLGHPWHVLARLRMKQGDRHSARRSPMGRGFSLRAVSP